MTDLPPARLQLLLNQISQGDESAVRELYCHYQRYLYAYLRHRIVIEAAIDEIIRETFLAVCRRPLAYDGRARFSTWLVGIAKNKLADWARKECRQVPTDDISDEAWQALPDPNWDFVERLVAEEDEAALRHCIDQLPESQREALFLAYYDEEKLETIAERQQTKVGTVKSRLFNARQRLRECMENWLQGGRNG